MSDLTVTNIDGQLLVDSRLIAERLGITHEAILKTIDKHLTRLQAKSPVRFEIDVVKRPQGGTYNIRYAFLNEAQATKLMTYSRNTEQVLDCKDALCDAFEKAKALITTVIPAQSARLAELLAENENLRLKSDIATLHGKEFAALAMGGGVIHVEVPVTEIVEPVTGRSVKILTAAQLKSIVKERTGQNLPSLKWFADELRAMGRDDLLIAVTRHSTCEYPIPDKLDDAIALVYAKQQQRLLGTK